VETADDRVRAEGPRGRRLTFKVLSTLFAVGAALGLFGLGLVVGWFDTSDGKIHRVHYIGFGVLEGIFVTVAFLVQLRNPERTVSTRYMILAAAVASLVGGLISSDADAGIFFFIIPVVALAILVAVHPAGMSLMKGRGAFSPVLGVLTAAGAVPLIWFAVTTARLQRTGPAQDPHVKGDHWMIMTAMLLAIVLVALLASLRYGGWRITAWCAGAGAFFYGLASAVFAKFPGTDVPYPGSKGVGWGLVAILGGLLFVAAAEWEARRESMPEG
jgi:hypothetical protein